uniref:Ig-like domain-containing protein n=1 Tax=Sinocyclocheilus grahami TaxID=75366 RepID=A0A672KNQ4_SINGR
MFLDDGATLNQSFVPVVISDRPSSPPSLLLLAPPASPLSEGDVSVVCVAQGFYPDGVTMSWSEDSSGVTGDEVQTAPYQRQADGTFSQTSVLKLGKQRWSSGRTYTCRLSHPALSTPLSQSTSLNQLTFMKPSCCHDNVCLGDVSVVCVAQGFYPDGVTMSWSEDSSGVTGDEVQTAPYQRQADGTFSQTSVLKLGKQRWSSGRTYTCRLSHPALSTPLSQSTTHFRNPPPSPAPPGDVSVVCVAQGFYPDGVTMSWSEDSSGVTGDEVQTAPYQRQADGTFSQTSVLKLGKQRWSSGRTYTCRLSHPALSTPLSQSTSLNQCM